ncbi:MAG: hypothetical protein LBT23_06685 [Synergistaceae bacterium]|nr:hypothetical protein [Synergistaceae bacterium]
MALGQIIVGLTKQRQILITMRIDMSHELSDEYGKVMTVNLQADCVDNALMDNFKTNDK